MSNLFADYLTAHAQDLNDYLLSFYRDRTDNVDLERYLYGPLERFTANAGKRHRPLICMLAAAAVGGDPSRARSAAAAIENFQTAALIHDDIADEGMLRRGQPCLHRTEGEGLAINCGDLALTNVTAGVLADDDLDDALKVRVLEELSTMTIRTIEGQALDLGWVRDERFDLTVDDYLTMATLKTAHYSGAIPLACGAIIGGGAAAEVEGLRSFGLDCGLAFQLQDDLLNLVGDQEKQGKDFRSDITEGKRTLIMVHALASPDTHDELVGILSAKTHDPALLARAVEIAEATGSITYARTLAHDLIDRAKATLAPLKLDEGCRDLLLAMADFFVERLG